MAEKSLKKNAILNAIKTIMGIVYPIITFPYASRILLPDGIGKVNFANSIVSCFAIIASLGVGNYATREAAKIRDNIPELRKLIKEILIINISSTIIAYILFFSSIFFIPKLQNYQVLLLISSLTIIFNTIGIGWFYTAIEEYAYITFRSIIFQVINIIFLFVFVKTKNDIYLYAFMNVIASVGSNICNFVHLKHFVSLKEKTSIEIKKHLKPIAILFGMSVAIKVYTILDSSMLGFLTNDTQVGYYSAATKINKMVLMVVTAIGGVLFPRLSYYSNKEDKTEFLNLLIKGFSITLCLAIPCTLGLHFLSKPITLLFSGENYLDSIPVMEIMNPIIIIISISNFIGIQYFLPLKKEKITLYSVIIGAVTNFSLNLILIPKYQALGAGIATVCAESCVTLFQLYKAKNEIDYKKFLLNIFEFTFASTVMSFYVVFITKNVSENFLQILYSVTGGAIIYYLILLILRNKIVLDTTKSLANNLKKNRGKNND
ncbi:MAG: flippase [Treponema sp.]|nr:flippase [Treponema sp.]